VFTARYGLYLYIMYINHLKPSGYYTYHQFNIHKFYVLPTQCIYVFCVYRSSKWLILITEKECVYCAVGIDSLYVIQVNVSL
jgi:hypothetical protein